MGTTGQILVRHGSEQGRDTRLLAAYESAICEKTKKAARLLGQHHADVRSRPKRLILSFKASFETAFIVLKHDDTVRLLFVAFTRVAIVGGSL